MGKMDRKALDQMSLEQLRQEAEKLQLQPPSSREVNKFIIFGNHLLIYSIRMASGGDMNDVYKIKRISEKRRKQLTNIPAEHQNLYTHGDRFLVHNAGIAALNTTKYYDRVEFRSQTNITVAVSSYEGSEPITRRMRQCIHAYALYLLYDTEWNILDNPTMAETLGPIITILCTYTTYSSLKESGLERNLKQCHIGIQHTVWNTEEEVLEATKEIRESVAEDKNRYVIQDIPGFNVTLRPLNTVMSPDKLKPWIKPVQPPTTPAPEKGENVLVKATALMNSNNTSSTI